MPSRVVESMPQRANWRDPIAIVLVSVVLIGSIILAVISATEALEERRASQDATELLLAAATVTHADTVAVLGGEIDRDHVREAIAVLEHDHSMAFHGLDDDEAARADILLEGIVLHGRLLMSGVTPLVGEHGHGELDLALQNAVRAAADDAIGAERQAMLAIAAALLAAMVAASLLVRSRHRAENELARSTHRAEQLRRLEVMMHDSPDPLFVFTPDGRFTQRSTALEVLLDPEEDTLVDVLVLAGDDRDRFAAHLRDSRGEPQLFELQTRSETTGWFDVRVSDLTDDELVAGRLVVARDVTAETLLRDELRLQARTDVLTGLPNRRALQPALDAAADQARATGTPTAFLSLDIDGFKTINDTLGHPAGDELLTRAANRLTNALGAGRTLIRLGGDEFAVILSDIDSIDDARLVATDLLAVLADPFRLGDRVEPVRSSMGLALTDDPDQVGDLISRADIALYEAKRRGGGTVVAFEASLESTATRTTQVTRALRDAHHDEEFHLVYQPIVCADTTEIVAVEALLRWTSPTIGTVTPDEFIPAAETTGEIHRIGAWVLDQVCLQVADWTSQGLRPDIAVSVNVSSHQLNEPGFVANVVGTAHRWGVPPGRLIIEVTESAALDQTGLAAHRLEQLRAAGFAISIDDFGSGYSNLGQLLAVPFDVIKIDRSLLLTLSDMREMAGGDTTDPCSIMEAIVSIAGVLGAPVVCEGVETEAQLTSLRASGISHVQGYLTGRPTDPATIGAALLGGTSAQSTVGSAR